MNTPCPLPDDLHRRRLIWLIAANNVLLKALALATQSAASREWQTWWELEQKMLQNLLRFVDTVELWQKANFHPDQPRVLAGNSDGGQWTDEGGGSDSGGLAHNVRQDVQSPLNPFKPLTVVLALHAAKAGRISEPAAVGRWPCGIQSPIYPGVGREIVSVLSRPQRFDRGSDRDDPRHT
jgi:hypothetical protein